MDNLPNLRTYAKLMYHRAIQEVEKHFVQDPGARRGVDWEHLEEGGGDNHTIMDLANFRDDENQLGSLVGDLGFGLSEAMEALDIGRMHVATRAFNVGFMNQT